MAKRVRNHRLEYQRRLQRALARGMTKSQARGHPRAGEKSVSAKAKSELEELRIHQALQRMTKGDTLASAARSAGLSSERLRRYIRDRKIGRKSGRRWRLIKSRLRWEWTIFSEGRMLTIIVGDPETSTVIGTYLNIVRQVLHGGDPKLLRQFSNVTVRDRSGHKYRLETRPNVLFRLSHAERETPEDFYRLI